METKFNFNSQVCTSKVQSERLLALGLKKETADCHLEFYVDGTHNTWAQTIESLDYPFNQGTQTGCIPAWSLHRLIEMMPNYIPNQGWFSLGHQGLHYSKGYGVADDGLYESIIRMYEWLIKEGYFNKEYLE